MYALIHPRRPMFLLRTSGNSYGVAPIDESWDILLFKGRGEADTFRKGLITKGFGLTDYVAIKLTQEQMEMITVCKLTGNPLDCSV